MQRSVDASARAFAEISRTVAGGASSYARLRAGAQLVVERAAGPRIWDADGNCYLDYCGGYGVNLFGHAPSFVWDAVRDVVARTGFQLAIPHQLDGEVGELVTELVPGIEQLRYAGSGTEATQAAVRLVRAVTGRDVILKFDGHFHGWADHLCTGWSPGSAARPGRPDSAGVPADSLGNVWVLRGGDLDDVREAVEAAGSRLAGVILEPVTGSGGLVVPEQAYLAGLLQSVRDAGGLVIFDEVMTGFRVARGGAQELLGATPDVTVLGKIIGGGFALAAFGGSREVMRIEADNRVVRRHHHGLARGARSRAGGAGTATRGAGAVRPARTALGEACRRDRGGHDGSRSPRARAPDRLDVAALLRPAPGRRAALGRGSSGAPGSRSLRRLLRCNRGARHLRPSLCARPLVRVDGPLRRRHRRDDRGRRRRARGDRLRPGLTPPRAGGAAGLCPAKATRGRWPQKRSTLRMPSCASISSKPRFTSSSVRRWESSASTSISPASQRSTSSGTCVRPLTPPKESRSPGGR